MKQFSESSQYDIAWKSLHRLQRCLKLTDLHMEVAILTIWSLTTTLVAVPHR